MTATDYEILIDAPTWAFVDATNRWYPPETAGFTVAQQRAVYDRMCAAFRQPRPAGVQVADRALGGVPCRVYEAGPSRATVLYFHGGGFVVGGLDSHDDVCAELCAATGLRLVSADYRLAPEHPHPAAFDDACAATRAAAAEFGGPVLVMGDSAGGSLAASVAHALRGRLALRGVVLIYPALGGDRSQGSYMTHASAPMLTTADVEAYAALRHGGAEPLADPRADALRDTDFSGLPPTVIFAAECDPLADDGPAYAAQIAAAGGTARCVTEPGLVHGYLRARHSVPRAADSFARIIAALAALA